MWSIDASLLSITWTHLCHLHQILLYSSLCKSPLRTKTFRPFILWGMNKPIRFRNVHKISFREKYFHWKSYFFFLKVLLIYAFYVQTCFVCIYICTPEQSIGSHKTTAVGGCEPLCGCWELNSGLLQEQPVFLTTEQSFQFIFFLLKKVSWLCLFLCMCVCVPTFVCVHHAQVCKCLRWPESPWCWAYR